MIESFEDNSLHFILQVCLGLSKPNQSMNSFDKINKIVLIELLNIWKFKSKGLINYKEKIWI